MKYNFDLLMQILHAKAEELPKVRQKIKERFNSIKQVNTNKDKTYDQWIDGFLQGREELTDPTPGAGEEETPDT